MNHILSKLQGWPKEPLKNYGLDVQRPGARWVIALIAPWLACTDVQANPQGMTVRSGSATVQQNGSWLNITAGNMAILNWNSFDIASGETTRFLQPGPGSIVFNAIGGANPSQIFGNLRANGTVILANGHGFYFGPNSMIQVGGNFIATTTPLPPDLGAGAGWQFTGPPPLASIVNYGRIQTGPAHSLFLIADRIDNHGQLSAPAGSVTLAAGEQVLVSERPDGRGLSARVTLPSGSVDNSGLISADAGSIAIRAQVVNQNGVIQADSVRMRDGAIELVASETLHLGPDSQILARGDDSVAGSSGGTVRLKSGSTFSDQAGSEIVTRGGGLGGNGGDIEVSAPQILSLHSEMDAGAQQGWRGGRFLLDPINITLGTAGNGSVDANGGVSYDSGSGTLTLNVNTAFAHMDFSQIDLQASGNITLAQGTSWDLSASTGVNHGQLLLQAGHDIVFGNSSQIIDANNWSVALQAGVDFSSGGVQPGIGNIFLNGGSGRTLNGSIATAQGSINLTAGQSILLGSGSVRTTGGGSIVANAVAGDINAGTANAGYQFSIFGYRVSANPGGITTTAGGDVTLMAGNNVISQPTVPANQPPGASGAYGSQPGNVTLIAGNKVLGNFTVANGVGTILAGLTLDNANLPQISNPLADIGSAQRPLNLGLIRGSWNLWAAHDVFLNEVRNPNGTFNGNQLAVPAGIYPGNLGASSIPARSSFLFDYAADAATRVWAGNGISLQGENLPRVSGQNQDMPPIYPPILSLSAGAGGINIGNPLLLYPSRQGALHITTRNGGDLIGAINATALTGITMSDSGLPGWATFAQGHALVPLHLHDPNPVTLDISGSIRSFGLTIPTFAQVGVHGGTYNFGFAGRNLSPSQTTYIHVAGDITYRGDLTSVSLAGGLPGALLDPSLSGDPSTSSRLIFNPTTGTLTFVGQMTQTQLEFLLNPSRVVLDPLGNPVLDSNGNLITAPIILTATQQTAIRQLFADSQSASLGDQGLALAGPGTFEIRARNINLGISGGINVLAPDQALAAISRYGASLDVQASGDLDMTSTRIANESYRGGITINVGGTLDVGGQFTTFGDPNAPKGIFTTSGGNVSVTATGNVNVNGSRIAAYDGGNINVLSRTGDVNAGTGGAGYVSLQALELDPLTGQLTAIPATIPGSGILATTVPGSPSAQLGNIVVNTPEGSINASYGGVIQIAFNGTDTRNTYIALNAGHDINAGGSGVIGSNLRLQAGGDITGLVVGSGDVALNSQRNIDVTAFGGGGISISAVGNVSGTAISPVVSASGDSITAALIGSSVAASGNTTAASLGIPQSNVPRDDARVADDASVAMNKSISHESDEEDGKRKIAGREPQVMKTVGNVTVFLPEKSK